MFKKIILVSVLFISFLSSNEISYEKNDLSTVRKIKVYKYPKWISQITTITGKKALFCSPKSMFEFYFNPLKYKEYGASSNDDITKILVTDYQSLEIIDARSAFFVYGSNKISPAGDDLVAFKKEFDAKNYASIHNGKRVMRFSKVSEGLIQLLNGDI